MTRARIPQVDLRWLLIGAIALAIAAGYAVVRPAHEAVTLQRCRDLYTNARSAAESLAVDPVLTTNVNPEFGPDELSCGVLRRTGRLNSTAGNLSGARGG